MEEVWKDIEWHKGAYKISNLGRVYSVQRKKIKNTFIFKCRKTHKSLACGM